jgi:hypothetical protein
VTEPKKPPPFTADNLPEAARAFFDDEKGAGERAARKIVRDLDDHAAKVINSLCAAHPGLREWLLNGTAPVATHEPPEVDTRLLSEAHRLIGDMTLQGDALKRGLEGFLQIVCQTHRPAADPVRFALEKVTDERWNRFLGYIVQAVETPEASLDYVVRSQLAEILPVAKSWAELTDAEGAMIIRNACKAAAITGTEAEAVASLRASLSAYAPPPRAVEVTPEVMEAFTEAWCALNEQNGQTFTDEPGYENLSRPIMTAHLSSFRAAIAVANSQANARESDAVAEVARLRDLVEQCERKIARKDAVLAHPEIQALLNKIGFGVEPGETEVERLKGEARASLADIVRLRSDIANLDAAVKGAVDRAGEEAREVERLRSLIGDDNIAALTEGRARIIAANQAPGMPHAACHACRIGDYCESADCPNARLEIERLEGELEQAEAQLDHANVELGLIVSERDALKVEVARLTKERDEAREKLASSCQALRDESDDYFTQLKATQAHAAKLEAMLTVPGIVGPVMLWRPFEQRFLFGWKDAEFSICFRPRDQSAHWMIWHAVGLELRQTPAPEAEEKRYRIRLFPPNAHIEFTTEPMTRADAEHFGEVIGPVN